MSIQLTDDASKAVGWSPYPPTRRGVGMKRDSYFHVVLPHHARAINPAAFYNFVAISQAHTSDYVNPGNNTIVAPGARSIHRKSSRRPVGTCPRARRPAAVANRAGYIDLLNSQADLRYVLHFFLLIRSISCSRCSLSDVLIWAMQISHWLLGVIPMVQR
jgi:hypothetical protein